LAASQRSSSRSALGPGTGGAIAAFHPISPEDYLELLGALVLWAQVVAWLSLGMCTGQALDHVRDVWSLVQKCRTETNPSLASLPMAYDALKRMAWEHGGGRVGLGVRDQQGLEQLILERQSAYRPSSVQFPDGQRKRAAGDSWAAQPVRPNFKLSSPSFPAGHCFDFNSARGCLRMECRYVHRCGSCGAPGHSSAGCPSRSDRHGQSTSGAGMARPPPSIGPSRQ
jgi:hypothetical protein